MINAMMAMVWLEMAMRGMKPHTSHDRLYNAWRQWASHAWEPAITKGY